MVLPCIFCCNHLHLLSCLSFFPFSTQCPISYPFLIQLLSPPVFSSSLHLKSFCCLFSSFLFYKTIYILSFLNCFPSLFFIYLIFPLLVCFLSFSSLLMIFISCPLPRPVTYQRQQCSPWRPLKNHPWPNRAQCHAGTSSKPVCRERWSSLCRSNTCSSARFPGPILELDLQHGASLLPFDQTSLGRVCQFLGNRTLGVA